MLNTKIVENGLVLNIEYTLANKLYTFLVDRKHVTNIIL